MFAHRRAARDERAHGDAGPRGLNVVEALVNPVGNGGSADQSGHCIYHHAVRFSTFWNERIGYPDRRVQLLHRNAERSAGTSCRAYRRTRPSDGPSTRQNSAAGPSTSWRCQTVGPASEGTKTS